MNNILPGIPDEQFVRGEIPMTKQEVRTLAMCKACIQPGDTVIDIGAGTGSLAVEAALLANAGQVFAVEKEPEGVRLIGANAARFGASNLTVIHGEAPAAIDGLPKADVIFIGGSGGALTAILAAADRLLVHGGRLVVLAVTVETLHETLQTLAANGHYHTEAVGLQITRLRQAGRKNMFQAMNPVYLISASKEEDHVR